MRVLHEVARLLTRSEAGVAVNVSRGMGSMTMDLNGNTGSQTVEEGAEVIVRMAQVAPDGPTGRFFDARGQVPW